MTDSEIRARLVDRSVLALTMWAEASGDAFEGHSSLEERVAVGCVIRNRLKDYAAFRAAEPTIRSVCFAPAQFSCWSKAGGAANFARLMAMATRIVSGFPTKDPVMDETFFLADGLLSGALRDNTAGSTLYYAPAAMVPPGRVPHWAVGKPTITIGRQRFLT